MLVLDPVFLEDQRREALGPLDASRHERFRTADMAGSEHPQPEIPADPESASVSKRSSISFCPSPRTFTLSALQTQPARRNGDFRQAAATQDDVNSHGLAEAVAREKAQEYSRPAPSDRWASKSSPG